MNCKPCKFQTIMNKNYSKVGNLTIGQDDASGRVEICLDRCEGIVPCRLFLVTISREFPGKHPVASLYHVIAPSESEAIQQVAANAFPEAIGGWVEQKLLDELTCTATPIPVHIRGWGRQPF